MLVEVATEWPDHKPFPVGCSRLKVSDSEEHYTEWSYRVVCCFAVPRLNY